MCHVPEIYGQTQHKGPEWLNNAVFYQIYPSSFKDSDGNGIGDIPGIISKLDYIKSLGVTALWINPVFHSGWFDGGYDVIDFYKVDPRFGTNTDLVTLTKEAHKLGIKVCLDLVAGHTSDKCAWFEQSMQADSNLEYSNYYIWTDKISEKEKQGIIKRHMQKHPESSTIGSFVEANAPRAKYYKKNFFECQPALNYGFAHPDADKPWEQPITAPGPRAVVRELKNIMAFWMDKGVDGFRVDMAASLVKNDPGHKATINLWRGIRKWMNSNYPENVLISEWANPAESIPAGFNIDFYIHFGLKGYPSLFFAPDTHWGKNRGYDFCYFDKSGKGSMEIFRNNYTVAYEATKNTGYIAIPSANHDYQRPNIGTRNTFEQLKITMTFFLTMPGVPFIYYGDEIGMKYQTGLPSKEGSNHRSGTRTPMQWGAGPDAGFSTCNPDSLYLPVDTGHGKITVASEETDPGSLLNYVRKLIALRRSSPALGNNGDWKLLNDKDQQYPMVYERYTLKEKYLVVLNPSEKKQEIEITEKTSGTAKAETVISSGKVSFKERKNTPQGIRFIIKTAPFSASIIKID
ncbi:MAG: alpha-amylase family glycosyl hydrolase [Bacteroidales bacterium]|nr:alpha-amylase family glycosyl hydrolase [Bacteroidales bacterium]